MIGYVSGNSITDGWRICIYITLTFEYFVLWLQGNFT